MVYTQENESLNVFIRLVDVLERENREKKEKKEEIVSCASNYDVSAQISEEINRFPFVDCGERK